MKTGKGLSPCVVEDTSKYRVNVSYSITSILSGNDSIFKFFYGLFTLSCLFYSFSGLFKMMGLLRYNSCTLQSTSLKVYNSVTFRVITHRCNHYHNQFQNNFITLQRNPYPLAVALVLLQSPRPAKGNNESTFRLYDLPILEISYKWNHTIHTIKTSFYLLNFGCAGSSLLLQAFLQLQQVGATPQAQCAGFSLCVGVMEYRLSRASFSSYGMWAQ